MSKYFKYVLAFIVITSLVYFGLVRMDVFTPEAFAILSVSLVAVIFERFPWLKAAWDEITDPDTKQLIMFLFISVLVVGAFLLSCGNVLTAFACTTAGGIDAALVLLFAVTFNQGVFALARKRTQGLKA